MVTAVRHSLQASDEAEASRFVQTLVMMQRDDPKPVDLVAGLLGAPHPAADVRQLVRLVRAALREARSVPVVVQTRIYDALIGARVHMSARACTRARARTLAHTHGSYTEASGGPEFALEHAAALVERAKLCVADGPASVGVEMVDAALAVLAYETAAAVEAPVAEARAWRALLLWEACDEG